MKISSVFKEIRTNSNKTQQEFADSIGVSRSSISQIEGDRTNPTIEIIEKIIKIYKVDANVFFDSTNSMEVLNSDNSSSLSHEEALTSEFVIKELKNKLRKLNEFYEMLVDIKMMSGKHHINSVESEIYEFIDDFSDIRYQYFSDLSYTNNKLNPYKVKAPIDINKLSKKQLKEYLNKLYDNLELFETMFFDCFKQFYNKFMKGGFLK